MGLSRKDESSSAIPTAGEIFPDGAAIQLLRSPDSKEQWSLVLCHKGTLDIKSEMPYVNRVYAPMPVDPSVATAVRFPTRVAPPEPTRTVHGRPLAPRQSSSAAGPLHHRYRLRDICIVAFTCSADVADPLDLRPSGKSEKTRTAVA